MAKMKKVLAVVLALALVFSLAATSASALDVKKTTEKTFNWGLDNILKPEVGSKKTVNADVIEAINGNFNLTIKDIELVDATVDGKVGFRLHLIQPTTGITLYDGIAYYDRGTGVVTFEKEWNLAQFPDFSEGMFKRILDNSFKSVYDSGVIIDDVSLDLDIMGNDVIDYTISNQDFVITAGHLDEEEVQDIVEPTEPATEPTTEKEIVADVTPEAAAPVAVADEAPLAAGDAIANTGDAGISAVVAISVLAGAAFVVAKKH